MERDGERTRELSPLQLVKTSAVTRKHTLPQRFLFSALQEQMAVHQAESIRQQHQQMVSFAFASVHAL